MRYTPHTLIIQPASTRVIAGEGVDTVRDGAITVRGQLTPMATRYAQEMWGAEFDRPHLLCLKIADKDKINEGDHVMYSGRKFVVRGIKIWGAHSGVNGVEAMLEELR